MPIPHPPLPLCFISAILPPSSLSFVTHPFITLSQRYTTVLHNHTGLALKNKRICILISISFGIPPTPFALRPMISLAADLKWRREHSAGLPWKHNLSSGICLSLRFISDIRWNFCSFLWEVLGLVIYCWKRTFFHSSNYRKVSGYLLLKENFFHSSNYWKFPLIRLFMKFSYKVEKLDFNACVNHYLFIC